jgi:hypothetical protein
MDSGPKPHIPINLQKLTRYEIVKRLKYGDPYNFSLDKLISIEDPHNESLVRPLDIGEMFVKWYATNEPGRIFRIDEIHPVKDGKYFYQTTFMGFEKIDRENE